MGWSAGGRVDYGRKSSEQGNVQFRRSLYFVRDMKVGDGNTYLRAQVDRVMEEDRAILAALAGIEKKSESEAEDD